MASFMIWNYTIQNWIRETRGGNWGRNGNRYDVSGLSTYTGMCAQRRNCRPLKYEDDNVSVLFDYILCRAYSPTSIHRPPTRQPPFRIPDLHPLHFKYSNMSYVSSSQVNPFKSIQIRVTSNACFIASFSKWMLRIRGNHGDPRHLSSSYERD